MNNSLEKQQSFSMATDNSDSPKEKTKHKSDALDEALRESFPASDPVAVNVTRIEKEPSENKQSPGAGHEEKSK